MGEYWILLYLWVNKHEDYNRKTNLDLELLMIMQLLGQTSYGALQIFTQGPRNFQSPQFSWGKNLQCAVYNMQSGQNKTFLIFQQL